MKELISLDEANRRAVLGHSDGDVPTGIACSTCKEEMYRPKNGIVYLSDPPKVDILCHECGRRDYLTI